MNVSYDKQSKVHVWEELNAEDCQITVVVKCFVFILKELTFLVDSIFFLLSFLQLKF